MRLPALKAEHDYETCGDPYCERFPCRVYREGYEAGYRDGAASGYASGYSDGYGDGHADGAASAGKG
jgi:hypothetical protein